MTWEYPTPSLTPAEALAQGYTHCRFLDDVYTIQQVQTFYERATEEQHDAGTFYGIYLLSREKVVPRTPGYASVASYVTYWMFEACGYPDEGGLIYGYLKEKLKPIWDELKKQLTALAFYPDSDIELNLYQEDNDEQHDA